MKRIVKVVSVALGVTAIAVAVKRFLTAVIDDPYDEDWDDEYEDDDAEEDLSACDEAYDRGYLHGLHGLPYAGKNAVALAFQDIAAAETMATYNEIVQENLQADVAEPYISEEPDEFGSCGKISDALGNGGHEDRGNAYNEAGRIGCASE